MKASLQLRDDRNPLVRAKLPLTALGLPFLSAFTAGDPSDLRVDLRTAFHAGPVARVSYRPNDARSPFCLALKMGVGELGSPHAAPITMSVEFSPLFTRGSGPFFSVVFKPRLGDFSLKKTTRSGSAALAPVQDVGSAVPESGSNDAKKASVLAPAVASVGGAYALVSGAELRASSFLPLRQGAALRFRWGVRLPPELRAPFDSYPVALDRFSFRRLPQLVMSKISIEHLVEDRRPRKQKNDATSGGAGEVAQAWSSAKQQLEALQAESLILRRDVRQLSAEVFTNSQVPASSGDARGRGNLQRWSEVDSKQPASAGERKERRVDAKVPATSAKARSEDVNEELKKALTAAASAAK